MLLQHQDIHCRHVSKAVCACARVCERVFMSVGKKCMSSYLLSMHLLVRMCMCATCLQMHPKKGVRLCTLNAGPAPAAMPAHVPPAHVPHASTQALPACVPCMPMHTPQLLSPPLQAQRQPEQRACGAH